MIKLLKQVNFNRLFWFFFYFFIFCLLLRNSFNYLDPDFGWHLRVGQEIAQTNTVPDFNNYNYTFTGNWVDHEWLSNFLVYFIYAHGGYLALSIIFALVITLVLVLLNLSVRQFFPTVAMLPIVLFQTLGVTAALPHFGIRMQESGVLFLLLLLLIINHYNKKQNQRILWWLPPLFYFWSCLHASFLIGLFILGSWTAIKIGEMIIVKYRSWPWLDLSSVLSSRKILVFGGWSFLSFGVTLFTPYKFNLYSFLGGYSNTFYQSRIQEWVSQFSFPFTYWQLFYLAIVFLALVFYIYYSLARERYFKIDLWTLFLVILFIVLSFKSRRHFPLLLVATFIFLIEIYSTILKIAGKTEKRPLNIGLKIYLLLALFLVSSFQLTQARFTNNPFGSYCRDYPCAASDFLKNQPQYDFLNIFNDYGWGGYLIQTLPDRKLFIDGRLPQVEFAGQTFLEEYLEFFKDNGRIGEKLNQYEIKLILIPAIDKKVTATRAEKIIFGITDEELNPPNHLRRYLSVSSDWRQIYNDQTAVIYLKNN